MRRRTNNILMLAYIVFIFVAVYTRQFYAESKWHYIVTAITVTSWVLVISDVFASASDSLEETITVTKPKYESFLINLRQNRSVNKNLDEKLKDKYGNDLEKTIGQSLDNMEQSTIRMLKTLQKTRTTGEWLKKLSEILMLIGFVLFFCVLLFDPVFSFFQNKLDGMTVLAFGTILAAQYCIKAFKEQILKISNSLNDMNESMEVLNQCCKVEATNNAD